MAPVNEEEPSPARIRPELTSDDVAVLAAFARGLTQAQVVSELHLSRRTLVRRMADVRDVLGVATNIEAVVAAVRHRLI